MSGETNQFDELLGELQTLAKAQEGDGKIVAASGEAGGDEDGLDADGNPIAKPEGDEAPMGKSFRVKLADGTEVEAQDGTELVKALQDRVEATEGSMAKALHAAVGLIKSQGEQLKALHAKVAAIGGEGRGRKSTLTVAEKPAAGEAALAKSQAQEGMTGAEFLTKAHDSMKAGRISGHELMDAEAHINRNLPPPEAIVRKVLAPA